MPNRPTSPHWYSPARFQQLLAGYLIEDRRTGRSRTVREVIAEFDGLSGVKARQEVAFDAGLHRATLEDLVAEEGAEHREGRTAAESHASPCP